MNTLKIIVVMFLWSICFPLISLGLPYAPHLTIVTLRALIAGAALLIVAICLRRPMPVGWKSWLQTIVVGLGATTLGFFGMFHAAEFVSPGIATVIANAQPILAAVIAHYFLGEILSWRGKVGLQFGFLGIGLIASPQLMDGQTNTYLLGVGYIALAAIGISLSNVTMKHMSTHHDPIAAMGWQLIIGAIPLRILASLSEDPKAISWTPDFVFSLLGLAIFGTAIVYWLWYTILLEVPLSRANAFGFLVPLFGLTLGYAFYDERFSIETGLGAVITIVGISLVSRATIANQPSRFNEPKSDPGSSP
jgi:drug/metabolite transporter (DMT)-like permease